MTVACLTFDVEERFHSHLSMADAPRSFSCGDTVLRLVDWLLEHQRQATFFVVGESAAQFPAMVRAIVDNGFELASHSHTHLRLDRAAPQVVKDDIARSKKTLEELSGTAVYGFRAPTWSAHREDLYLWDHLIELGFSYDSSLFPVATPMYGSWNNALRPYRLRPELMEIPPSAVGFGPLRLPFGGGFYFRAWPLWLTRALIHIARLQKIHSVLYFHPWELDPGCENIDDGHLKAFIANHGVNSNRARFEAMISLTETVAMRDVLAGLNLQGLPLFAPA